MAKTTAAAVAPASPDLTDPFIYYFQRKEDSGDTMKAVRIFNAYVEKYLKGDVRDTVLELNDALCFSIEKQGFRAGFKAATAKAGRITVKRFARFCGFRLNRLAHKIVEGLVNFR